MNHFWKKASFTVEAAFLVPCAAIIVAVLIGFVYYMHETVWAEAVAFEADYYALQRTEGNGTREKMLEERIVQRSGESPLGFRTTEFRSSSGSGRIRVAWTGDILSDIFKETFRYHGEAKVRVVEPVKLKRMYWLAEYMLAGKQNSGG